MTDRVKGFMVALDRDIRVDDVRPILAAIKMIKGVIAVEPSVTDHNDWMNRSRIRRELGEEIWNVLYQDKET